MLIGLYPKILSGFQWLQGWLCRDFGFGGKARALRAKVLRLHPKPLHCKPDGMVRGPSAFGGFAVALLWQASPRNVGCWASWVSAYVLMI